MSKRVAILLTALTILAVSIAQAQGPFLWEADTGLGGITDKAKIGEYLDNLKAHGVNGVWVQVELYSEGTVNYKKTTLSGLPTAEKFKTGQWADDDFLSYVIAQAKQRGMQVMIKFHGSNHPAWDQHPDWRKLDSKGKEVLWSGRLKNFCVNSPYWDKMFFPMLKEIAANYDVDGFYLDTCQVAYETDDSCFCPQCKARFQQEAGKPLPLKAVDGKNWTNALVKQHAIKRVEWLNKFYEKYRKTIDEAKPGALALLNVSGGYNSYKDTLSTRHAGKYVSQLTPEPVNTPRMWAVTTNRRLQQAKQKPVDENELAREEIVPWMNRYGYMEFMTKTMLADGGGKPVVPISRYWFTDDSGMGPLELEKFQIESAIAGGAKGYCFFGYLANALATGKTKNSTWDNPEFIDYLKDLTTGPRAKWIADMQPDPKVGILYDRDADFWTGDYWGRLRSVGEMYAVLQYLSKVPVGVIATSEPDADGFGKTGYKLDPAVLNRYDMIFAPGLNYVCTEDLQALRSFLDKGGQLILMGGIGRKGKFLGQPNLDDALRLLGVSTPTKPVSSGFLVDPEKHPLLMTSTSFMGPMDTSRISADGHDALSYAPKYGDGWLKLVWEVNDNGRHVAMLSKENVDNTLIYVNSDMASDFSVDMRQFLQNMIIVLTGRMTSMMTSDFDRETSVNIFKSADCMRRYVHILSPNGEKKGALVMLPAYENTSPVSAEIIVNGGDPKPIKMFSADTPSDIGQMSVGEMGGVAYKMPALPPGFAMIKVTYQERK